MSKTLRECLNDFNGSDESFSAMVKAAIELNGQTSDNTRIVANEFEVAESTVTRWANGTARPHPRLRGVVAKGLERLFFPRASP